MFKWLFKKEDDRNLSKVDLLEKMSDNPWVTIVGEHVDAEKGIKIELDWNDPFVKYLKQNGYTGINDEIVVGKWLTHLYAHLAEKMRDANKDYE